MVNAWSLLYDEYYGTMNKTYPVKKMSDENRVTPQESDEYDPIVTAVGSGSTDSAVFIDFNLDDQIDTISIDTSNYETLDLTGIELPSGMSIDQEYVTGIDIPTPGIQKDCTRKYKEDESIKALQDYISTTYGGHYTSDNNNVQTLDLIESVGDAESFCRSNAIKYLSRYDKKGQAKRDILKALHYSLLLYHFSGQLNETPTRGYETF
jgi:tryptophan synthase beta subunit